MESFIFYACAAVAEIAGCYAFWACFRMSKSPYWLIPGLISLVIFAFLLTRVESAEAGRAYSVYGGIYILFAVLWMWGVEGVRPDRWDIFGLTLCLAGAAVIFLAPHRG
ncbi:MULTISPECIES: YnfA family protein [Gluconobacter]|uniref:YnfA family protein n=1 Tax=Gluconobacter TaxID=441 RepID=UPI000A3985EC|nr:YnfA family protein [Gluconobacter sp. DsW_056]OUI83453.1 membrane protein [Gluconobacter sp. DsW_056]